SLLARWRAFAIDRESASLRFPRVPHALLWMIGLGPVLFIALWPWLWFDTADKIAQYIAFHLNHYPIYLFYDGEIWEKPFALSSSTPSPRSFGARPHRERARSSPSGSLRSRARLGSLRASRFAAGMRCRTTASSSADCAAPSHAGTSAPTTTSPIRRSPAGST